MSAEPIAMRPAQLTDAQAVATIWREGWRDGHLGHVPDALVAARTPESFAQRAVERAAATTVAVIGDDVAGFVMVVGDEVEQVYVAARHRGSGVASALLDEAARQVAAGGHARAWLAVASGNARARRFYERGGWTDEGAFDYPAVTDRGPVLVPCHRYEKRVAAPGLTHGAPDPRIDLGYNLTSMSRIRATFGVDRVVLPVVHPVGLAEALASVEVAHAAGAKGIFTINQGMDDGQVLALISEIHRRYPALWVGVNLLGHRPAAALRAGLAACGRIDGVWSDNALVDERAADQPAASELVTARAALGWTGLYFGGVAFKYQREIADAELGRAAVLATSYMDVVCTSGPGTGKAADLGKLIAMRQAVGPDAAIALASGITPDNIATYLPYVDAFLVGTGIEARLGVLDAGKLAALLAAARG